MTKLERARMAKLASIMASNNRKDRGGNPLLTVILITILFYILSR